jgi:electron transfer flavoprotein beta subunit
MKIIVCVKQVPDPEAPPGSFKIDPAGKKIVVDDHVEHVVSTFDENAVEAALRIKDDQEAHITVLSCGGRLDPKVIKKPLAMGCDDLVLLEGDVFEDGDSWSTAYALACAIRKIDDYQIILCGRQASDWDSGQVGSGVAEFLGIPCITLAKKIEVANNKVKVNRLWADGIEILEAAMPCLITVSSEMGEPRYSTISGVMAAAKKQPTFWGIEDIGVSASEVGTMGRKSRVEKVFKPVKETKCEIIEGETEQEAAVALALRLREENLL